MKSYKWYGKNFQGAFTSGEIEAFSYKLAKFYLSQQKIKCHFVMRKMNFFIKTSITSFEIALFLKQLALLINSGIPLVQACIIISKLEKKLLLKNIISAIKNEIELGKNLSLCLTKFPKYFDSLSCYMIELGEQSGLLDKMLFMVSNYKEKTLTMQKKFQQALIYPGVTIISALFIIIFMLIVVVPRFEDLFSNMHSRLPFATLCIIHLSHFLRNSFFLLLIPPIMLVLIWHYGKRTFSIKNVKDKFFLFIPYFGTTYKKILLSRFSSSLAATFSAGVPILESLPLVSKTIDNFVFQKEILQLQNQIAFGISLHTAMERLSFFPPLFASMIKVGEETGKLDLMLEKISTIYEIDIDNCFNHFNKLLEPLIILILGVLIGGVVIAMYLPIFKLGTFI